MQLVERLTKFLNDLPDDEDVRWSIERGKDEIIYIAPLEHSFREFRANKGVTITINVAGGVRNGLVYE